MKAGIFGSRTFLAVLVSCLMAVAMAAPAAAQELITNGDFSAGMSPWWTAGTTATVAGGVLSADVPASTANPWDAIVGQSGIALSAGTTYTLSFDAWASTPVTVRTLVQLDTAPFTPYFVTGVALTTTPQTFSFTFTAGASDPAAAFQLQLGGSSPAFTASFDNVSLTSAGSTAPPSRIGELVKNGRFATGSPDPWWGTSSTTLAVASGRLEATVVDGGANPWDAIVGQNDIPVYAGASYTLRLKAWASADVVADLVLAQPGPPFARFFSNALSLTTTPKIFTFTFTASGTDPAASLQVQLGGQGAFVFFVDDVSLNGAQPVSAMPVVPLLGNSGFDTVIAPWWTSRVSAVVSSGALVATVSDPGTNRWDNLVGQNGIPMLAGGHYTLSIVASADRDVTVAALIQKDGAPFTNYFFAPLALTTTRQTYSFEFTSGFEDPLATFQFQIGSVGPFAMTLDSVTLVGPKPAPPTQFLTAVRVNQTGYLPRASKRATVAVDVTTPLPWTLFDASDTAVASGQTSVFGADAASGEQLQIVDFSSFKQPGEGYALEVYGERSAPFVIGDDVYARLQYDALAYFYHNRSGIEIALPFAGEAQWTRAAGHLSVSPNRGDLDVPCFEGVDLFGASWTGCDYTLDAIKGWYDAGDHGKYVVNGGIAVWTMLNQYERAKQVEDAHGRDEHGRGGRDEHGRHRDGGAFADGTMSIPENANSVPDILDEARFELEFLLAMQVPPDGVAFGQPLGGMVHHKLHDAHWTVIPLLPSDDPELRSLYPPSTAATLNLAAVGAQCARIYRSFDRAFAGRCLTAAEAAWRAAQRRPAMYARANFDGGGPYDDTDVTDEFYWAAAELYITTGKRSYYDALRRSPHFLELPGTVEPNGAVSGGAMSWGTTQALGTISLALVPSELPMSQVSQARRNIIRTAEGYLRAQALEPYGVPYVSAGGYFWGSNSAVLNNMMVLGLAHDFTGESRFARAVGVGMDYILGRNPNVKSFVSGYGTRALENPTHHFWAHEANASFPPPFPGAVAGGPNQYLQDPFAASVLVGCAPQKCYVDDIASYSTNEIAINWNAPLAWAAAFLDDAQALRGENRH